MLKHAIVAIAILNVWGSSRAARAELLAALDETEIPNATGITALHSLHDKAHELVVRLLEADSADVAKNPVALFLVISNEAGGPDLQERVWRLPRVSVVKRISLSKAGLRISAMVDGQMNEKTGRLPEQSETLNVSYSFAKGRLADHIQVVTSRP